MKIKRPSEVSEISPIAEALDASSHAERMAWAFALDRDEQLALYALAVARPIRVDEMVHDDGRVWIHPGRNGLPRFNRFEKRFARLGSQVVGYNHNDEIGGPFNFLMRRLVGPGHYVAYDGPDGGVWVDYRELPTQQHPAFPPLIDNEHGVRGLVFGNMVDVVRRVSNQVFVGNAYKDKSPGRTWWARFGSRFPTAPFVLVQPEEG